MGTKKDTTNFFTTETERNQYWEDYLTARPDYTQNGFYASMLQYHRSRQGQSLPGKSIAHDVGTGPGQVAAALSGHFDAIVASDLNQSHLTIAQKRLARSLDSATLAKISYERLAAEDVHTTHAAGSAAFVAVGETMPLLDHAKAIHSWATLLRPSGTLAIWFYGRPHFVAGEGYDAEACQQIYDTIADAMFAKYIKNGSGPAHTAGWKRATDCMSSFLDNVDLDPENWTDVQRWKWNSDCEMSFYGPEACDFDIEVVSRIRSEERVDIKNEPDFWGKSWGMEDWKLFLKMNLPAFKQEDLTPDIERGWAELEKEMGGSGARHGVRWPVVVLLATKA
jgi:SAM-dependent methyltransferase